MRILLFLFLSLLGLPCLAEDVSSAPKDDFGIIQIVTMLLSLLVFIGSIKFTVKEFSKAIRKEKRNIPPQNISPAEFGFLACGHTTLSEQFFAMLLEWARLGMICFDISGMNIVVRKTSDVTTNIIDYEKELFSKFFYESSTVPLKNMMKERYGTLLPPLKSKFSKEYSLFRRYTSLLVLPTLLLGIITLFYLLTVIRHRADDNLLFNIVASLSLFTAYAAILHFTKILIRKIKLPPTQLAEAFQYELFFQKDNAEEIKSRLAEDPKFFEKALPYAVAVRKGKLFLKLSNGIVTNYPSWFYKGHTVADFPKAFKKMYGEQLRAFLLILFFGLILPKILHIISSGN